MMLWYRCSNAFPAQVEYGAASVSKNLEPVILHLSFIPVDNSIAAELLQRLMQYVLIMPTRSRRYGFETTPPSKNPFKNVLLQISVAKSTVNNASLIFHDILCLLK